MSLIADLTGYEEEFVTELQESLLICFIQLTFAVSDLLTKRFDLLVSVLHHKRTMRDSQEPAGESSEIRMWWSRFSHANTIDSGVILVN